jgi:branched-chain amino acid transport system permease protein
LTALKSQLGCAFEALRGSPVAFDRWRVGVPLSMPVISAGFATWPVARMHIQSSTSPIPTTSELTVLFLLAVIMAAQTAPCSARPSM